jgi:hypothetical protein
MGMDASEKRHAEFSNIRVIYGERVGWGYVLNSP